jgi:hypothetical protein
LDPFGRLRYLSCKLFVNITKLIWIYPLAPHGRKKNQGLYPTALRNAWGITLLVLVVSDMGDFWVDEWGLICLLGRKTLPKHWCAFKESWLGW